MSFDWPAAFPPECASIDGQIQGTITEQRHQHSTDVLGDLLTVWQRETNCQTVSPISPPQFLRLPEEGFAGLICGALLLAALARRRG